MEGIKERLLEFLKHLGIGQSKFEQNAHLSNGLINNLKNNLQSKSINKISAAYPQLNTAWLLTGEGEMAQRGIEDVIRNKLSEYNSELSNSEINVDMTTGKIQITNVPDELREKVIKALQ